MARFADDRALYGSLGRLFRDALEDDRAGGRLRKADACLQLRFRDPDAVVTALLRGAQSQVDLGPSRLRPDATIAMDGDAGHEWLLGELNPTAALSDGRMKTRGPSAVVLNALAMVKVLVPVYQGILEAAGEELPESLDASLLPDPPKPAAAPEGAVVAEEPAVAETASAEEGEEASAAEVSEQAAPEPAAAEEPVVAETASVEEGEAPVAEVSEEAAPEEPAPEPDPPPEAETPPGDGEDSAESG